MMSPPRLPRRVLRCPPGGLIWLRHSARALGAAGREIANRPKLSLCALRRQMAGLFIAAQLAFSAQAADEFTLLVAPGDTLIGISQRFLQDPNRWPELKRLNQLKYDTRLKPGSSLRIPLDWLRWTEGSAEVVYVQGVVSGTVAGANVPLVAGMQLKAGDSFDTGASGALTLRLYEGASAVFPPQTQAALGRSRQVSGTNLRDDAIELKKGSADSTVAPLKNPASRFEIRTPRVVTAVRGTRLRVVADGEVSRLEVVNGVVGIAAQEPANAARKGAGGASLKEAQGLRAEGSRLGKPVALLPAADVSSVPRRIERIAQGVTVPALPGAQGWRWQIATDAAFAQLLQDERTTPPAWLVTGLPDGDYHLRVRAADAQELEGLEAQLAIALRARPEPPVLLSPPAGASVQGANELSWAEGVGKPAYQVQVARDARFADLVLDRTDLASNRLPFDPAWPPGDYHWRAATLRAPGAQGRFAEGPRGPFGDPSSFTLLPPSVMAPPQVGEEGLQLAWSGPPGYSHKVQVATDADFAKPEFDKTVPGARLDLPTPPPGIYYVRTQVVLPGDRVGAWSSPQKFEIPKKHPWTPLLFLLLLLPLL